MSKVTLEALVEAAQATDAEGKTMSPEARQAKITELLGDAERADVDAILNESIDKFNDLNSTEPADDAGLFGLELLVDAMTAARAVQSSLDEADAARAQQRADLAARVSEVTGETEPAAEGGDTAATTEGEGAQGDAGDPAVVDGEAAGESTTEGGEAVTDTTTDETTESAETSEGAEMVAASGKRSHFSVGAIKGRPKSEVRAPDDKPAENGVVITAAANLSSHGTGQTLDGIAGLTAAAIQASRGLPRVPRVMPRPGAQRLTAKAGIASLSVPFPDELVASAGVELSQVLRTAVDEKRLEGESLVAAGGWCAPSTTLYDIPGSLTDANAGLLDLPEISVERGGVRFRRQVDYGSIYSGGNVGRVMTEAMSESADAEDYTKVFYRVDCPDFVEARADAVYTGISAGILQNHAYPEEVEAQVAEAIAAHGHRVNEISLEAMEALFGGAGHNPVDLSGTFGPSTVGASLNGIEWVIVNERTRLRASESLRFKVVLPIWYKMVFRADYANRAGIDNALEVSDAQIEAWFSLRGASVDWVYDWQDALSGNGTGVGSTATATSLPTTVKAMIYPEGTIVRGRGDIINMEAVYDSVGLTTNDFLRLFMEESLLIAWRAYRGSLVTLPLAASGATGAALALDANGKKSA